MRNPDFERLLRILSLEEADRVPFFEVYADNEVMEAVTGKPLTRMDLSDERQLEQYLRATAEFYGRLGYDYVPLRISPDFPRNNVLLTEDTAVIPRERRRWLDEQRGVIKNKEDLESYPWPDPDILVETRLARLKILRRHLPSGMKTVPYTSGVFENVTRLLGTVPFLRKIYTDKNLVEALFEKVGSTISFYVKAVAEENEVGAIVYNDDMGYKSGPMMSPNLFRRYVFPWQKMCAQKVHKAGKPFILHSCGNLRVLMEDLIEYVGIDAKHSYQDSTYSVTAYKKLYGHRIAILGGVDVDKLARLPLSEFKAYVKKIIRECAPGGGYALGSGNTVTNYVSLNNYLVMLKTGEKYGRYPTR